MKTKSSEIKFYSQKFNLTRSSVQTFDSNYLNDVCGFLCAMKDIINRGQTICCIIWHFLKWDMHAHRCEQKQVCTSANIRHESGQWPWPCPTCVLRGGSFLEPSDRNVKPHRAAVFLTWTLVQEESENNPKKIWPRQQRRLKGSQEQRVLTNTRHTTNTLDQPFPCTLLKEYCVVLSLSILLGLAWSSFSFCCTWCETNDCVRLDS